MLMTSEAVYLAALKEALLLKQAKTNIFRFCEYMQRENFVDFKFPPTAAHHQLMVNDLHLVQCGIMPKLSISLPPGSAKSTYASVIFPCWLLAQDPTVQVLCVSASEGLAEEFSRRRRQILRSDAWQRLAGSSLHADAQSLSKQITLAGGGITAAGQGGSIQGLRADYLISDDLVRGFEQANSVSQLDKIFNWYLSEARSRLKPGGKELLIATRWSAFDPIGRFMELAELGKEEWKFIRIPMLCDSPNDPLNRQLNEMLWPEWFTPEMLKDAQRDPAIFNCLYQQRPLAESGEWCPPSHLNVAHRSDNPKPMRYVIGVDIALSITAKSDFTVFALIGIDTRGKIYIVDLYRNQESPEKTSADFVKFCAKYKPVACYLDNDNASKVWSTLVWQESKRQGIAVPLSLVKMGNKDKETRAAPLRTYLLNDQVTINQDTWTTTLLDEFTKFPAVRHDDIVDAVGVAASQLLKVSSPKERIKVEPEIQPQIGLENGKLVINSGLDDLFSQREGKRKGRYNSKRI